MVPYIKTKKPWFLGIFLMGLTPVFSSFKFLAKMKIYKFVLKSKFHNLIEWEFDFSDNLFGFKWGVFSYLHCNLSKTEASARAAQPQMPRPRSIRWWRDPQRWWRDQPAFDDDATSLRWWRNHPTFDDDATNIDDDATNQLSMMTRPSTMMTSSPALNNIFNGHVH